MTKLWVVTKNFNTHFIRRLRECLGHAGVRCYSPWAEELEEPVSEKVLLRATSVQASEEDLRRLETQFPSGSMINPLSAHRSFWTKPLQYEYFQRHNIGCLPWLDLSTASREEIGAFTERTSVDRYLIKPHRGQQGWGIRVLRRDELRRWSAEALDREFLVQPFLSSAREYRYFFIRGHWSACLERTGAGPAANFSQGGKARLSPLPAELETWVERLSSGLHYGAIDFLLSPDQGGCLDLNLAPGIEQLEAVTGEDVMRILVRSVLAN